MRNLTWILLVLGAGAMVLGCGGGNGNPDAPTGEMDGGAGETDAPSGDDARVEVDAPAPADDAPAMADAPAGADAPSGEEDACVPPVCARPPLGCEYQGATECTCGTLVCEPGECDPACSRGEFCDLCASRPTCETRPVEEPGICPGIYAPECGCDGVTYDNDCTREAAGIGLLRVGACEEEEPVEGCDPPCRAGFECQECRGIGGAIWSCIPEGAAC
jgi:hypothetical protein